VVAGGNFGWPQFKVKDDVLNIGVGGFDRTELYQDPWTEHIYVAGHGDSGPAVVDNDLHVAHASVIFRSRDEGKEDENWEVLREFDDNGGGWTSFMTSTPNHPLIALRDDGEAPTLWYMEKGTEVLIGGFQIVAKSQGLPLPMGTLIDDNFTPPNGGGHRVARMSWDGTRDRVWVIYPNLDLSNLSHPRQRYVLCSVEFGGISFPKVELIRIIEAEDSANSCTHAAFVQDDRVEWNPSRSKNFTMLYWIERSMDVTKPESLRYKVIYGNGEELHAENLSVAGGARKTFDLAAIGHYMAGGFYYWGGTVNFIGQWVEPGQIRGNVVSVRPKKP
jgi:hypothetical protein